MLCKAVLDECKRGEVHSRNAELPAGTILRVHGGIPPWDALSFMRVREGIPSWHALSFMRVRGGIPPWHALSGMPLKP